ncbi:MAG TPA: hypothetical protein VNO34_05945 [Actinomycetota bacterium]|nr:hypothetical protein [Actinomycetota bacterium]
MRGVTGAATALGFSVAAGWAVATLVVGPLLRLGWPRATNYRGRELPVVLGAAVAAPVAAVLAVEALTAWVGGGRLGPPLALALGALLVFGAGVYDDSRPWRTHGLLPQLRPLLRGRLTPGAVKLGALLGAAALAAAGAGVGGLRLALGVPLVAGAANLWNLFDVAPGRAVKLFLPAALALSVPLALGEAPAEARALGAALGAVVAVFALDLRERAMLGDGGSNLLGFLVGAGLLRVLPAAWLAAVLAALVALHLVGETLTLSRLIRALPPLRWWDELGRLPPSGDAR